MSFRARAAGGPQGGGQTGGLTIPGGLSGPYLCTAVTA